MRLPNPDRSEFCGESLPCTSEAVVAVRVCGYRHRRATVSDHQQISDFYPLPKVILFSGQPPSSCQLHAGEISRRVGGKKISCSMPLSAQARRQPPTQIEEQYCPNPAQKAQFQILG